jgi:hypothetical protein
LTRAILGVTVLILIGGCGQNPPEPLESLDEAYFRCRVQPVLTKRCSAFACHGTSLRFFRVYARNRLRLGGTEEERNAFLRPEERAQNFAAARAYAVSEAREDSLLLKKPLDQSAGGFYHGGATLYGAGDVFLDTEEPEYRVVADWLAGEKEDTTCMEPGSDS